MIKSTSTTLKFSNKNKKENLSCFIDEYKRVVSLFVDLIWDLDNVPSLLPNNITSQVDSWLSARAMQCAAKQASGIVRGTRRKQKKRLFIIKKLTEEGKFKQARKLQRIYDNAKVSKPKISSIQPELDSRFVKTDIDSNTSFDGWLTLTSIGNKLKLILPFKKTSHFNKMLNKGEIKSGIRLSKKSATFMFDIKDPIYKENGETLGIDVGLKTTISCSNGFSSKKNNHGYNLDKIVEIISRKKKKSKAFFKACQHRKNYINWSINQLNLNNIKEVRIENIKNMRKGKRANRKLSHWTYTEIFSKLESYSSEHDVHVKKINPTYTSKRCSNCGWTCSRNRKGKQFVCRQCVFRIDADTNAARNIAADLAPIFYRGKKRRKLDIKKGFWWKVEGEEPIVSLVQKT